MFEVDYRHIFPKIYIHVVECLFVCSFLLLSYCFSSFSSSGSIPVVMEQYIRDSKGLANRDAPDDSENDRSNIDKDV